MSVRRPPSAGFSVPEARGDVVPEGGRAARRGDSPPRRGRATHDADDTAPRGSRAAHDTDDTVPRGGRAAQDPGAAASQGSAPAGIRIHKAMAQAGVASRREAERLIAEGQVRVNGEAVARPGRPLIPGDRLEVRGRAVAWEVRAPPELWALYKPKRCVCTLSDPEGRRTVKDYFPRTAQRLFPVGRLDYDAEGLLLLTSDGALAQRVLHPSFGMPRVYLVKVRGIVEQETLRRLAQGVRLEGRVRQPARTRVLHTVNEKTWLEVVLREGIQHHIKKMFDAVGHPVLKIKRYRIGPIELGDLQPGKSRRLGQADMDRLTHWAETGRADSERAGRARIAPPPEQAGAPGPGGADEVPLLRLPPAELARA
jgi:23S rRNA pseudouridine2605 synthase